MQVTSEMQDRFDHLVAAGFVQHRRASHDVITAMAKICDLPESSLPIHSSLLVFLELCNDAPWSTPQARSLGLRDLAMACLQYSDVDASLLAAKLRSTLRINFLAPSLSYAAGLCPLTETRQVLTDCAEACSRPDAIDKINQLLDQAVATIGNLHEDIIDRHLGHTLCYESRRCAEAVKQAAQRIAGGSSRLDLNMRHLWFAAWFCIEAQTIKDQSKIDEMLSVLATTVARLIVESAESSCE